MKRLLISTTALAVALAGVPPFPVMAQDTACVEGQVCPPADDKAAKKAAKKAEKDNAKAAGTSAEDDAAKAAKKAEREAAKEADKASKKAGADTAAAAPEPATAPAAEPAAGSKAADTDADKAEKKARKAAEKAEKVAPEATTTAAPAATEAAIEPTTDPAKAEKKAEKKAAKAAAAEAETAAPEPTPEATPEAEAALSSILVRPSERDDAGVAPAAAAAASGSVAGTGGTEAAPVDTTETVLTEDNTRSSREEFRRGQENDKDREQKREKFRNRDEAAADDDDDDDGLSDFEKFGLVALGALAVGMILKNGDRVVENTGDRVVVSRSDGTYQVWRDDDTLIRQPGSTVRTETFNDGSTRTTVTRDDGSRIVTIRDVSGRVLRRSLIDSYGRETLLIDDLQPVQPIDVTTLPRRPEITLSASNDGAALEAALAAARAGDAARGFSLAQVRDVREVRALAPRIEVAPITFASGSAAIDPSEAEKLAELGGLVARMVKERPNELFLIEGHTDAVGDAASNLALSDRRAESVALALTEYFDVPPENLVVQGYGEGDLLVPTLVSEPRNRRVAVRVITPLLAAAR